MNVPVLLRIAGVPEPYNLPWHLGIERRAFLRAGIDLQWTEVPEGTGRMCQMLRDSEVDVAVLVTEGAVRDIALGSDSRIIGTFVESPLTWAVHVPARSSLRTPQDLTQVPFAISRFNSGSHLMAVLYAQQLGWQPEEKDFVVVNNLAGAVERMSGADPIVFLWDRFVTAQHVADGTLRVVDEFAPAWPAFVVVARSGVIDTHAKLLGTLLKVVRDQAKGLAVKSDRAEVVARRYAMSLPAAKGLMDTARWAVNGNNAEDAFVPVEEALVRAGLLPASEERQAGSLFKAC